MTATATEAHDLVSAVWLASILEHVGFSNPDHGGFTGTTQTRIADDFRRFDTEHVETSATREQRIRAERLYGQLDEHPDQATLIRGEAN